MHDAPLPQCEAFQCEMKKIVDRHIDESGPVREAVTKHDEQIRTVFKAQGDLMEDVRDIQKTLVLIDAKVDNKMAELKIWILSAAIAGLLVLLGEALYFGGILKQVDVNNQAISELQSMHPRIGK